MFYDWHQPAVAATVARLFVFYDWHQPAVAATVARLLVHFTFSLAARKFSIASEIKREINVDGDLFGIFSKSRTFFGEYNNNHFFKPLFRDSEHFQNFLYIHL